MTTSNELREWPVSPVEASQVVVGAPSGTATYLGLEWETAPEVIWVFHDPQGTPDIPHPHSLAVMTLSEGLEVGGWRLKSLIMMQMQCAETECVASTWLEGVLEYGVGERQDEAIVDLLISLGEYLESLDERETTLGDSAKRELDYLRKIIERAGTS